MTSTDWEREIEELSWGGSIRRSSLSREIIRKPNQQNWTEWLIRRRVWQLIGWREVSGRTSGSWFRLDEWMGKAVKRGGIEWGGVWDNGICRTSGECFTGTYIHGKSQPCIRSDQILASPAKMKSAHWWPPGDPFFSSWKILVFWIYITPFFLRVWS